MVKDREVEIMEKLYEAFLDNWGKHAPDFLLFLWGQGSSSSLLTETSLSAWSKQKAR